MTLDHAPFHFSTGVGYPICTISHLLHLADCSMCIWTIFGQGGGGGPILPGPKFFCDTTRLSVTILQVIEKGVGAWEQRSSFLQWEDYSQCVRVRRWLQSPKRKQFKTVTRETEAITIKWLRLILCCFDDWQQSHCSLSGVDGNDDKYHTNEEAEHRWVPETRLALKGIAHIAKWREGRQPSVTIK